uniref:Uncharacterized protein n=1 Tax=Caenorhabditis japonica TaxID=281687 RepID=A0A8R1ECS9_CAEJA
MHAKLLKNPRASNSSLSNLPCKQRAIIKKIRRQNSAFEKKLLSQPSSHAAKSLIRKRLKTMSSIPPLSVNGSLVHTDTDIASTFF